MVKLVKAAQSVPMTTISHDTVPRIMHFWGPWCASYGTMYVFWQGTTPTLSVVDPEMIKDIMSTKLGCFHRGALVAKTLEEFVGRGFLTVEDNEWMYHRRIINSTFHIEKLKGLVGTMVASTNKLMKRWKTLYQEDTWLEVDVVTP
ncbi:hypothetical protein O6H91_19G016800 [Diphasiastrum complanatum]|uniref:Uncharacterized protein n=1 Tax=Diphasiastrum complanatum TaxID=34168 RepID=A0ACC2AT14_DIPCM|nr:hypothetical protein O6H91_19G016800 [Diphasiastrum complanatum]